MGMNVAKVKYISSMLIFGSIGIFVRMLPYSSAQIALARGMAGCVFLLSAVLIFRKKLSVKRIRGDLRILIFSGIAIGINWILLFESYRFTSIANATVCYYFAPVIVVAFSPFILKERFSLVKLFCVGAALTGIMLITGTGRTGENDIAGIICGLGAAVFYAAVIFLNKFFRHVTNMERTIIQLGVSTVSLLPYVFLTSSWEAGLATPQNITVLLIVGIIHTGFAYFLYFSGLNALKGQTAALLSYIDPLTAILLSALLLREPISTPQILGIILILGGTLINDLKK